MDKNNKARNIYVDLIRAFSVLFVVLYHYTTRYKSLFNSGGGG